MRSSVLISVGLVLLVVSGILFAQGTRQGGAVTAVPGVAAAKLHIAAVRITNTQCGKPLEFNTIIKNVGSAPFNKQAAVIITVAGNHIAHTLPMSIPAGGSITDKQSTLNQSFLANCCQEVNFVVTMGTSDTGGEVPEWDKVPFKVGTKPGSVVVVNQSRRARRSRHSRAVTPAFAGSRSKQHGRDLSASPVGCSSGNSTPNGR